VSALQDWQIDQRYHYATFQDRKQCLQRLLADASNVLHISQDSDMITGKELKTIVGGAGLVSELRRGYVVQFISAERIFKLFRLA